MITQSKHAMNGIITRNNSLIGFKTIKYLLVLARDKTTRFKASIWQFRVIKKTVLIRKVLREVWRDS